MAQIPPSSTASPCTRCQAVAPFRQAGDLDSPPGHDTPRCGRSCSLPPPRQRQILPTPPVPSMQASAQVPASPYASQPETGGSRCVARKVYEAGGSLIGHDAVCESTLSLSSSALSHILHSHTSCRRDGSSSFEWPVAATAPVSGCRCCAPHLRHAAAAEPITGGRSRTCGRPRAYACG